VDVTSFVKFVSFRLPLLIQTDLKLTVARHHTTGTKRLVSFLSQLSVTRSVDIATT